MAWKGNTAFGAEDDLRRVPNLPREVANINTLTPPAARGDLAYITIHSESGHSIHMLTTSLFVVHPWQFNDIRVGPKSRVGLPCRHTALAPRVIVKKEADCMTGASCQFSFPRHIFTGDASSSLINPTLGRKSS